MKARKLLSAILIFALVLTFAMPASAFGATSFSDARGHWAEAYINKAVSKGIVTGYPDGKFRPDASVTRAEFITMVNKALGNKGSASVNFNDTPAFEWYYQTVAKAVAAAYTGGYDDGTFRPNAKISRQEAAVMISRIVPTYGYTASLGKFKDASKVASWAASSLSKVNGKGYIGAYDDGLLHPEDSLTRAQTAKIIMDIMDKENIVTSATTVSKDGTTLSGRIYSNGVTISKDLDDGEATISNCVVLGTLSVQGGGVDTITAQNSRIANATVSRSGDPVRLLLKGETTINKLNAERTATIETSSLAGGDFGEGAKTIDLQGSSKITLIGNFPKVNIDGRTAELILDSGTITDLDVTASARDASITVESKATITNAKVNAQAAFRGAGTIRTMNVEANNVTYEKKPGSLTVGSGVTVKPELVTATAGKFDPKDGETGVKASVNPTITFNSRTETGKGDKIDSEYLESNIVFRKNTSSGAKVPFTAKINSANTVITIMPDEDLDEGKYYLGFTKSAFRNYDTTEALIASSATWTVGNVSDQVTFKPANGDKNVSKTISPTMTFKSEIETYSGREITRSQLDSMIEDDDLYLYKGTSKRNWLDSGDATINSAKKIITINPGTLDEGEYTFGFEANTFRTKEDSKRLTASSVKFTVGNPAPTVTFSPSNGATNIGLNSSISITFSEKVYNSSGKSDSTGLNATYLDGAVTVKDGSTTLTTVKSFNSGYTRLTISPPTGGWVAGKTYTVTVNASKFRNSSGAYVAQSTSTFKTAVPVATLSALTVNGTNVLTSKAITVPYGTETVKIIATANDAQAIVKIMKGNVSSGDGKATITWETNLNPKDRTTIFDIDVAGTKWGSITVTKAGPDTAVLDSAITSASNQLASVVVAASGDQVDSGKYWTTQDVYNDLLKARSDAQTAKTSANTPAEVTAAATALETAINTFKDNKWFGTKEVLVKTELSRLINDANTLKNGVQPSVDGSDIAPENYWATQSDIDTFVTAISTAEGVIISATTQTQLNDAKENLQGAYSAFQAAKQAGTKGVIPDPEPEPDPEP